MQSYLDADRLYSILTLAGLTESIDGVFAEVGVYEGGTTERLANAFPNKTIYAFDTFTGHPPEKVEPTIDGHGAGDFGLNDAQSTIEYLNSINNVRVVSGVFPESVSNVDLRFAFVHLDVDLYKSTLEAIEWIYPRMVDGGIIAIDDWNWEKCAGAKLAVEQFMADKQEPIKISASTIGSHIQQAFIIKGTKNKHPKKAEQEQAKTNCVLVTLYDDAFKECAKMAVDSAKAYASKYGHKVYHYPYLLDESLHPSWNKVIAVSSVCEEEPEDSVVVWFDSDILFDINGSDLVEPFKASGKEIVFSQDWNGLCAGMFAVKNTPRVRSILDAVLTLGDVADCEKYGKGCGVKWEQNAFKAIMQEFPAVSSIVGYFEADVVNDSPTKDPNRKGQIALHFSWDGIEKKAEKMSEYLAAHSSK
jgi:hypothetical protein